MNYWHLRRRLNALTIAIAGLHAESLQHAGSEEVELQEREQIQLCEIHAETIAIITDLADPEGRESLPRG